MALALGAIIGTWSYTIYSGMPIGFSAGVTLGVIIMLIGQIFKDPFKI